MLESRNGEELDEESDTLRYCCDLGVGTWTCDMNEHKLTARRRLENRWM